MKRTGRAKSSIYSHIHTIAVTPQSRERWQKSATKRLVTLSKKRKGKSALDRHPIPFNTWTADLVRLTAHLAFDGQITYASCVYSNRSKALIDQFIHTAKQLYPYEPKLILQETGVFRVSFHNVELAKYLENKRSVLLSNIIKLDTELQREFLRTFFDDEGSIYFIGKKRRIRGYQHDAKTLSLIKMLLMRFGIESKLDSAYNEIVITGRQHLEAFAKEIGFSKGVRVNGNRSNSVWRRHLEKNNILKRAIASYTDERRARS